MITRKILLFLICCCLVSSSGYGASKKLSGKKRVLVVSSYHQEYHWSRETNAGFCDALLKFGYFDNEDQIAEYTTNDFVETSKVVLKKLWMDAKKKSSKGDKNESGIKIYKIAEDFKPDLIFLGDDDAAEHVGRKFLDTAFPIVFWGVNNTPVKYGLVDNELKPGHNVTGVYQSGYKVESLKFLKTIVPHVKTFAILSDETSAGRNHVKALEYLDRQKALPLKLIETVSTSDYESWKRKALELQKKVDAFFMAQYSGLKNGEGNYVTAEEVAKWYINNITIPEAAEFRQFVKQGMLCGADDSGYNQGFEAVVIAHDILTKGANPSTYPPRTPKLGRLIVNKQRAAMLGITLTPEMGIEEYVEEAAALKDTQIK